MMRAWINMRARAYRRIKRGIALFVMGAILLTGCGEKNGTGSAPKNGTGPAEKEGIIATSPAVVSICDKLELPLVGVCTSTLSVIPDRYTDLPKVGPAMNPDMEIVASLAPEWILSPSSLQEDLQPKYENLGVEYKFLDLKSVEGMYDSIEELGDIFGREEQAEKLIREYENNMDAYKAGHEDKQHPKVLILMGLPGAYVIATPSSYVGNLVELAGGENVYPDTGEEFLTVNTEDMLLKKPDVILRAAHAMPDSVREMFAEDFENNDIWKHFDAVEKGRVYDLNYETCGMSANLRYMEALEELERYLYE